MKTYLSFSINGDITEIKTKDKLLDFNNFKNFKLNKIIQYKNFIFIILYNNIDEKKNISKLPFIEKDIFGDFLLISIDNEYNIKSITENLFLKLINIENNYDIDYSSDDLLNSF